MQANADRWRRHGFALDFSELVFPGDRAEVAPYLRDHNWSTTALPTNDLLTKYGLTPLDADEGFADIVYITAAR